MNVNQAKAGPVDAGGGVLGRGRAASATELAREVPFAVSSYLDGALDNPLLDVGHVLLMLRNKHLGPSHLRRIAADRRFCGVYEVRAALAVNPATPPAFAMNLVGTLFWRDLLRIAENYRVYPPLRRRAEQLLSERCAEMTEGEMVALAHIVGRFLIKALSQSERPRVVSALLGNAHLVEEDVVAIARSSATPPEILRAVARSDRWSSSRAVRLALTRNPATPVPESLRCLGGLLAGDLEALARDARVPKIVRIGAERRLGGEKVSSREPRPQVHQRPVS